MTEFMHLLGAEQVSSAAHQMRSAADQMVRAASQMDETLTRHRSLMEEWLCRFEQAVSAMERARG